MKLGIAVCGVGLIVFMFCDISAAQDDNRDSCGMQQLRCNATQCCGGLWIARTCVSWSRRGALCGQIFNGIHCIENFGCGPGLQCVFRRNFFIGRCRNSNSTVSTTVGTSTTGISQSSTEISLNSTESTLSSTASSQTSS